jgi:hypothetical protein
MPLPETDFGELRDERAKQPAFKKAMRGKCYGHEALNDAWGWFKAGWECQNFVSKE